MMKQKKLLFTLALALGTLLGSFGYAGWTGNVVPVQELYEQVSCVSGTNKVYLNQDNDGDALRDFSRYLNSNFILSCNATYASKIYAAGQILRENAGTPYTNVQYYTPLYNMFYTLTTGGVVGMINDETFWRASRVFPCNTPVRGIASTPNQLVFEQPSNNDAASNTVSIVYDYKYKFADGRDGTTLSPYRYHKVPSINYMGNTDVTYISTLPGTYGNRKRSRSSVETITGCQNFELHRCGDGVKDEPAAGYVALFTGELCDDGPNNGQPGYCPIGCGILGAAERCGDKIIQEPGTYYRGTDIMSFEACDDGDNPNDTNEGFTNCNDPASCRCDLNCSPTFSEAFVEIFIEA